MRATGHPDQQTVSAADGSAVGDGSNDRCPSLADGIELIGAYEDSGYKEAPSIVRRADGQIVQLPDILYLVAERCDGRRTYAQIADEVSQTIQRQIAPDDLRFLVDKKLRPLGLLKAEDGSEPEVAKADPFLALKFRAKLVPAAAVRAVTTVFKPLYFTPVVIAFVAAFLAFDFWLFFVHGVGDGLRQTLYNPSLLLLVLSLLIAATVFHEIGHATACRYGGADPGVIGVGIYLVWPAFYTDVTDSYRLNKWGRMRVDLGGVYFNAVFILGLAGLYALTGFEALLIAIVVVHLEMFQQFLPFVRLDGYYVVSDFTGVPDLFSRIRPILASFIPGHEPDERVTELKPWVRIVVTGWVLTVIPFLLFNLGLIALHAPRIFGTAWDSFVQHWGKTTEALRAGAAIDVVAGSLQSLLLLLPLAGIVLMFAKMGKQAGTGAWKHSDGRPALRSAYMTGFALVLAALGYVWWPNGDYRPIQPGERWTVQVAASAYRDAPSGRGGTIHTEEAERSAPIQESTEEDRSTTDTGGADPDEKSTTNSPSPSPTFDPFDEAGVEDPSATPAPTPDAQTSDGTSTDADSGATSSEQPTTSSAP